MVTSRFPLLGSRFAALILAVALFPAAALASTPCQQGADCNAPAFTNELYGFIASNRILTFASPGPIYDVLGDVIVKPGVTLTVEPGVTLRFAANHDTLQGGVYSNLAELTVQGTLVADASAGDSIRFISSGAGFSDWGQIRVESTGSATLRKVRISGAVIGLALIGPGTLTDVAIADGEEGIDAPGGGPYVFLRLVLSNVTHGILFGASASGTIRECAIHGRGFGGSSGLQLYSGVSTAPADSTQPVPTEVTDFQYGVIGWSGVTVCNLVARNNNIGLFLYYATANYCTSVGNTSGVYAYGSVPMHVFNSIAASNGSQGIASQTYNGDSFTDYCDSWSSGSNYAGIPQGPNTASFNPFFVNPASNDYHLATNSIFKSYSVSGGEIGAYGPGTCLTVAVPPDAGPTASLKSSPNPTRGAAVLQFEQATPGRVTVDILDVLGRRIGRVADDFRAAGPQRVEWSGKDERGASVAPGLYFWRVTSGSAIRTGRLVVSR